MELPPPPPGLDLSESQTVACQVAALLTWSLAIIAVALRYYSRRVARASLWYDDWLMLVALTCSTVFTFVIAVWQTQYGLGRHIWGEPNPSETVTMMLGSLLVGELVYTFSMLLTKLSILALYWRLFKRKVLMSILILLFVVVAWAIGALVVSLVQCRPLRGFWDKTIPAKCDVDVHKFFIANAVPNIVTDIALLALPLFVIWKLQMSTMKKIGVSTCFLLGSFVSAVSIVRLHILLELDLKDPDITWTMTRPSMWTTIEVNVAIVSGCLPILKPLFTMSRKRQIPVPTHSKMGSAASMSQWRGSSGNPLSGNRCERLISANGPTRGVKDYPPAKPALAVGTELPLTTANTVNVQRDFEVTWHHQETGSP